MHAFIAADPITTSSDLAFESTRGVEESVGDRITVPGTFDTIPELAPGASASSTPTASPSACWGPTSRGSTGSACTRSARAKPAATSSPTGARAPSCLRYLPRVAAAHRHRLVLPVRHQVLNDPDGTLSDEDDWLDTLGEVASSRPSSTSAWPRWTSADLAGRPAVPDAADRLTAGNPPRELVVPDDAGTGEGTEPEPPPSDGAGESSSPQEPAPSQEHADIAEAWLASSSTRR